MPGQLRERDGEGSNLCQECDRVPPVGPCAACHAMICADCGVFSRDPEGDKVICTSCARLVASVSARAVKRRPMSRVTIALLLLIGAAVATLAALLR